jgi:pyruvate formate lyase activating enzyme
VKEARFYRKIDGGKVQCELCPHFCLIDPGESGFCRVRKNIEGALFSLIYGKSSSVALDPIEKKPLYRFHSGEFILSAGTKGCNLVCPFCQNWTISQDIDAPTEDVTSMQLVELAKHNKSFGIAYTYNEPFIWYEFVYDTAKLARENGLCNVLVTNGMVNLEPLEEILPFIDAMNIDIKSIKESFYKDVCKGSLKAVQEVIKRSVRSCHVELTNLIVPTLNDTEEDFTRLTEWIYNNLGDSIPIHFSRYFPCHEFNLPPTPVAVLKTAQAIAREKLKYVYLGNV